MNCRFLSLHCLIILMKKNKMTVIARNKIKQIMLRINKFIFPPAFCDGSISSLSEKHLLFFINYRIYQKKTPPPYLNSTMQTPSSHLFPLFFTWFQTSNCSLQIAAYSVLYRVRCVHKIIVAYSGIITTFRGMSVEAVGLCWQEAM